MTALLGRGIELSGTLAQSAAPGFSIYSIQMTNATLSDAAEQRIRSYLMGRISDPIAIKEIISTLHRLICASMESAGAQRIIAADLHRLSDDPSERTARIAVLAKKFGVLAGECAKQAFSLPSLKKRTPKFKKEFCDQIVEAISDRIMRLNR